MDAKNDNEPKREENRTDQTAKDNGERSSREREEKEEKEVQKEGTDQEGKAPQKRQRQNGEEFPLLEGEAGDGTKCVHNKSSHCPWCDKTKEEEAFDD